MRRGEGRRKRRRKSRGHESRRTGKGLEMRRERIEKTII